MWKHTTSRFQSPASGLHEARFEDILFEDDSHVEDISYDEESDNPDIAMTEPKRPSRRKAKDKGLETVNVHDKVLEKMESSLSRKHKGQPFKIIYLLRVF